MPLVTSKEMLTKAQKGGYAVGAFNAENMEMVKAIIQAAEELKAPVMIQTTPSTVKYGTVETYAAIVAAEAEKASVKAGAFCFQYFIPGLYSFSECFSFVFL